LFENLGGGVFAHEANDASREEQDACEGDAALQPLDRAANSLQRGIQQRPCCHKAEQNAEEDGDLNGAPDLSKQPSRVFCRRDVLQALSENTATELNRIPNPKPQISNPKSQTPNPKPQTCKTATELTLRSAKVARTVRDRKVLNTSSPLRSATLMAPPTMMMTRSTLG